MWTTPSGTSKPSSDTYLQSIASNPEDYRVLERVPLNPDNIPIEFCKPQDTDTTLVILDTETMGKMNVADDHIIELGMIRCRYDVAGKLAGIDSVLDMFEDPGEPLSREVTKLTGITDDMVRGKQIDRNLVLEMLQDEPVVAAHNAAFDRPRFDQMIPNELPWVCTMQNIPWGKMDHSSRKLEVLLQREGWFYEAHRACVDVLAVAWLLHMVQGSLHALLEPKVRIRAYDAFEVKDTLKERGYKWDPLDRSWWKDFGEDNDEREYLANLYPNGYRTTSKSIDRSTAFK